MGIFDSVAIECEMKFLPVARPGGSVRRLFESLIGPDKLMPARCWGGEIDQPLPEGNEIYDFLERKYNQSSEGNEIKLGITGGQIFDWKFFICRDEVESGDQPFQWRSGIQIHVPFSSGNAVKHFDTILDSAYTCNSHLISFDYRDRNRKPISTLYNEKLLRSVRSKVHKVSAPGDWRGLSCVPWRLALGDYYIDMFGEERLQQLPRELGYRHSSGYWVLQTSENAEDSLDGEARLNEQIIIDILGQEFFFNKETGELPQVVPDFPPELIPSDQALIDEYGPMLAD